jgi:hypothetical protein
MTFLIIAGVTLCVYALFGQAGGLVMWELLKWPLVIIAGIVGLLNITWWTNLLFVPAFILALYPMEKMPDEMGDFLNLVVVGAFVGFGYYILTLFG